VASRRKVPWLAAALIGLGSTQTASATTGGPTELRILGWSEARSAVLISFSPGGENDEAHLLAFNPKEKILERATCDTCASITNDSDPHDLDPDQRDYQRALRGARKLGKLEQVPAARLGAAGVTFQCKAPRKRRCEDDQTCYLHRCTLGVEGQPPVKVEFLAKSHWYRSRFYRMPGVPDAAMAWIVRTGLVESGYRQDEVFFVPKLKRRETKLRKFVAKYFP
jgi:hypothetical protein